MPGSLKRLSGSTKIEADRAGTVQGVEGEECVLWECWGPTTTLVLLLVAAGRRRRRLFCTAPDAGPLQHAHSRLLLRHRNRNGGSIHDVFVLRFDEGGRSLHVVVLLLLLGERG